MAKFTPLKELSQPNQVYKKGDVFVLFGELFGRGYVNGLVDMARKAGMTIIGITVGRRDKDNQLRVLTAEEHAEAEARLGGKIINIPLEAGFDNDAPEGGKSPCEMLKDVKMTSWDSFELDWDEIAAAREAGVNRFVNSTKASMAEIEKLIPEGANVFFAHTMAGGVLRAKIMMPVANRVFKGMGKRYISSKAYWESSIGKLCAMNFEEVTANTFKHLLDLSASIRNKVKSWGGETRYTAYGYHGTAVLQNGEYNWQTYTPYKQGYAKKMMEDYAEQAWEQGIKAVVFNCPEIRTNSSDIFAGVEIPLFPLISAIKKEGKGEWVEKVFADCQEKLSDEIKLEDLLREIEEFQTSDIVKKFNDFEAWPMDNTPELAEIMVSTSDKYVGLHKDRKDLIVGYLSALILDTTGEIIFNEAANPKAPALWIGHDIIAKLLAVRNN